MAFSWTQERIEVPEQTVTLKSRETGNYRKSQPRSAFRSGKHWNHKLVAMPVLILTNCLRQSMD